MMDRASLTGLILAGGQGRRMQGNPNEPGVDKGLLEVQGLPLVAHARCFLAPHVQEILVSANNHFDEYVRYGRVVPDDAALGEYSGPLAGIASALRQAATPWLFVMPVDVIGLPADLVERLCSAVAAAGPRIAYAGTAQGVHPLCMVLHAGLRHSLHDFLQAGERRVQRWLGQNGAVAVMFEGAEHAFINVNTPQDLALARRGQDTLTAAPRGRA